MSELAEGREARDWAQLRRALTPSRWHWLSLLCGPSSYLLLVSLIAVAAAKLSAMNRLQGFETGIGTWLGLIAGDVALHFGLISIFAFGEARSRRLLLATVPLAILVSSLAMINALYLNGSGEQLSWEAFTVGIELSTEVFSILSEEGAVTVWLLLGATLACVLPLAVLQLMSRYGGRANSTRQRGRAIAGGWIFLVAVCGAIVAPTSSSMPVRVLQTNATLATYWGWVRSAGEETISEKERSFQGYQPIRLAHPSDVARLAQDTSRPNILLVILESVRWDFTSLASADAPASTPNLEALARRGTLVQRARAVIPHTSKSLFSMLCGRLPMMQRRNYEAAARAPLQCLPALLEEAGYETTFMQTALGSFEDRPRLIERLGFQDFKAWEDIQGEPLGYLASDDESLAPAFAEWLDARKSNAPFFATLLTSSTHHPYRLSAPVLQRVEESGAAASKPSERYARLIEAQDHLLGNLLNQLEERGLAESTLVVVVGDHGEGFGAKGVLQHDNNFYEEGLHVPLVLVGPGVPNRSIDKNVSLVDLTPTLLELIGLPLDPAVAKALPGASIYTEANRDDPRYFACYFDGYCYGYVQADHKVFIAKGTNTGWYFDLAADPRELQGMPATEDMRAGIAALIRNIEQHHSDIPLVLAPLISSFGNWQCPDGLPCRHPRSPEVFFDEEVQ